MSLELEGAKADVDAFVPFLFPQWAGGKRLVRGILDTPCLTFGFIYIKNNRRKFYIYKIICRYTADIQKLTGLVMGRRGSSSHELTGKSVGSLPVENKLLFW